MYCQLELETTKEKVFTGPFVFRLEDGIKKLARLGWLTKTACGKKRGVLKLVEVVGDWPRETLWHPKFDDESGERHMKRIVRAEWVWTRWEERREV